MATVTAHVSDPAFPGGEFIETSIGNAASNAAALLVTQLEAALDGELVFDGAPTQTSIVFHSSDGSSGTVSGSNLLTDDLTINTFSYNLPGGAGTFSFSGAIGNDGGTLTKFSFDSGSTKLTLAGSLAIDANAQTASGTISSLTVGNSSITLALVGSFATDSSGHLTGTANSLNFVDTLGDFFFASGLSLNVSSLNVANLTSSVLLSALTSTSGQFNGDDKITLAFTSPVTFDAGAGNDVVTSGSGVDHLFGGAGNDTLDGGLGADTLEGGAGNDTYVFDGTDTIVEAPNAGSDTILTSASFATGIANVENITLTGTANIDATGDTGNNVLTGNSGNNVLDGGAGNDTMAGGLGSDTYFVDAIGDKVIESGAGIDTVFSSAASFTLGANVENLVLQGAALNGTGNGLNNVITGNALDNVLDGGGGNDILTGGDGNDTYVVNAAGDVATEASALGGTDLVKSSVTYTLGANLENLTLTGSAAINGTGNALDNIIAGNSGANILDGRDGSDTLIGGAGNDTYLTDGLDTIVEAPGGGIDRVVAGFSVTLAPSLENVTLTPGSGDLYAIGNDSDNQLTGNEGNNLLDGGAGNDAMAGGAGNDTYLVDSSGDSVTEGASAGDDTVLSSASSFTAGANVETLILLGGAIAVTGNASDNGITGNNADNVLSALGGNDELSGGVGSDTMDGGAGDDTLDGGQGYDRMTGGAGNDFFVVTRGDGAGVAKLPGNEDTVVELANGGVDTVQTSTYTYTLDANVEDLVLVGSARKGFGNALDNHITGDAMANTLDGGAGNDVLDGGAGADRLTGGSGQDKFVFDDASSIDRISDFASTDDTIVLKLAGFGALNTGALTSTNFHVGATAGDADDFIVYDDTSGALYYDADGNGGGEAVRFAQLAGAPALTEADFIVA